jgi:hypothetical protein
VEKRGFSANKLTMKRMNRVERIERGLRAKTLEILPVSI